MLPPQHPPPDDAPPESRLYMKRGPISTAIRDGGCERGVTAVALPELSI
jgi:hypothetical protein